jgi:hypothetical protein
MDNLIIPKGDKTPSVIFNTNGELRIEGRSTPENSAEFYQEILDWVKNYGETTPIKTELHIKLEYFNSSSSKLLLTLFRQLEEIKKAGFEPTIHWYYDIDDEDMIEAGQYYEKVVKVPFFFADLSN